MSTAEIWKGPRKSDDSAWFFDFRRKCSNFADDESDSGDDHDAIGTEIRKNEPRSEEARLLSEIDLSLREETVTYKPNPFSLAKISAATRAQAQLTNKSNITGDGCANTVKNAHIITPTHANTKTGVYLTNPLKEIIPATNSPRNKGKSMPTVTKNGNVLEGLKRQAEKALKKRVLPEPRTRLGDNPGALPGQLSKATEQPNSGVPNRAEDRLAVYPTAKEESPGPRHIMTVSTYSSACASLPNESSPFPIGLLHPLLQPHPPPSGPQKLLQSPQTTQDRSNLLRRPQPSRSARTDSGHLLSTTRLPYIPFKISEHQLTPRKSIKPEVETQPGWQQPHSNAFVTPIKRDRIHPRQDIMSPMTPVCKISTPVTIKKQQFSSPLKYDPVVFVHTSDAKLEAHTSRHAASTHSQQSLASPNLLKREENTQFNAHRAGDAYSYAVDDPDEEWSTLPARKRFKQSSSSSLNGIKTSGPIRVPALLLPTTSLVSQQRVKTFFPPPIRTHNPGEVIDFLSPADNRHPSINVSGRNMQVNEAARKGSSSSSSGIIRCHELAIRFAGARNQTQSLPSPPTSDPIPIGTIRNVL